MTSRTAPHLLVLVLIASAACDKDEPTPTADTKASPSSAEPSGFTKYQLKSKTSEARVQLAKLFDGASSYFMEEHIGAGDVVVFDGGGATAAHACPNDGNPSGSAGITPPLSVKCSDGPGGHCVPVAGEPKGPGQYSMDAWTKNKVWNGLNFMQEQGHYFHYDFRWVNDPAGYGGCKFTAQAFADLDEDGVFSTFERSGAADENGTNAGAGLHIDQELE